MARKATKARKAPALSYSGRIKYNADGRATAANYPRKPTGIDGLLATLAKEGAELVESEPVGPITILRFSTGLVVRWAGGEKGSGAWEDCKAALARMAAPPAPPAEDAPPVEAPPSTSTVEHDGGPTVERWECCGGPVAMDADTLGHCAWCAVIDPTPNAPTPARTCCDGIVPNLGHASWCAVVTEAATAGIAHHLPAPMTYERMLFDLWNDADLALDTWEPDPAQQGDPADTVGLLAALAFAGAWLADDPPSMLADGAQRAA